MVVDIAKHNPEALMNGKVTGSIGSANGYTKEIQLTNFKTERYGHDITMHCWDWPR